MLPSIPPSGLFRAVSIPRRPLRLAGLVQGLRVGLRLLRGQLAAQLAAIRGLQGFRSFLHSKTCQTRIERDILSLSTYLCSLCGFGAGIAAIARGRATAERPPGAFGGDVFGDGGTSRTLLSRRGRSEDATGLGEGVLVGRFRADVSHCRTLYAECVMENQAMCGEQDKRRASTGSMGRRNAVASRSADSPTPGVVHSLLPGTSAW